MHKPNILMKFSRLGLLGVLGATSLGSISQAQFFIPGNLQAHVLAKDNSPMPETKDEIISAIPESSTALAPINPYLHPASDQIVHLEFFRYVPESNKDESELDYLEYLRKERQSRKNIEYLKPMKKVESWMKAGISLYSANREGYYYNISIKSEGVELKEYSGIIKDQGKINGFEDLGVVSFNTVRIKPGESKTLEIEAVIRAKSYPGDVIALEKREIIVD